MTREEAAKILTELWGVDYHYCLGTIGVEAVDMAVEALHQLERKKGKWIGKPIAGYSKVRCSVCNDVFLDNAGRWNYCPNCGAEMKEGVCNG